MGIADMTNPREITEGAINKAVVEAQGWNQFVYAGVVWWKDGDLKIYLNDKYLGICTTVDKAIIHRYNLSINELIDLTIIALLHIKHFNEDGTPK